MIGVRNLLSTAVVAALAASFLPLAPAPVSAQSSQTTVLVAPLIVCEGVHRNFGEDVAEKVREALQKSGQVQPIDEDDVEDLLDQYGLEAREMTQIEWRQLASQMSASLVMVGSACTGGQGIEVEVSFMDPRTGDELPVETFSVADRGRDEEAAERIESGLATQFEYLQSIAFCSEYLASEQIEDALRNCERALEINPRSTRARYLRARARMAEEAYDAAVDDLEHVVSEEPSNTEALQSLAYTHAQLGNKERSLELYQEYLNFNPNDAEVRLNIAFELARAGGNAEAMRILQDGVERAPDNIDLWQYLGSVALAAGQSGGEVTDPAAIRTAVEAFEKVLEARGNQIDPSILENVINAYALIEDYDEALAFSERAIEIIRNPPADSGEEGLEPEGETGEASLSTEQLLGRIYAARANVHVRMENWSAAASDLDRALRANPDLTNGYQRLGVARLRSGNQEGAIEAFRTAVEQGADPDQIANALFGQGYNDHFQRQQFQQAIALFDVAAEFARSPDVSQQIHFFTAYGHFQRGTAIDNSNQQAEACGPARQALAAFQQVLPHLNQSGNYQAGNQAQIREATDVQLYRQEQIIKKSCG